MGIPVDVIDQTYELDQYDLVILPLGVYWPTLRLYRLSPIWTLALPAIALLYTLMTLDSARRHWQGQGGAWKGRVYPG